MLEQKIAELIEVLRENNILLSAAAADRGAVISKLDAKVAKASKVDDEDGEPVKPVAKRGRPPKAESDAPAKTAKTAKTEPLDFSEMDTAAIEKALEAGTATSAQVLEYLSGLKKLSAEDMTSATKAFLWVGGTEDGESRKELCKAILAKLGVKKFNVPELDNADRKQVVAWFAAANAGEDVDLDAEDDGEDDFA